MKFPRNARIFRGQLDAAPFAAVFLLLAVFLMLSSLVYTPGVLLKLPMVNGLPGTDKPTIAVAIDRDGRLYYHNQWIEENQLRARLSAAVRQAVTNSAETPVLLVQADESVSYKRLMHLTLLARDAGLAEAWLATLPRPLVTGP